MVGASQSCDALLDRNVTDVGILWQSAVSMDFKQLVIFCSL